MYIYMHMYIHTYIYIHKNIYPSWCAYTHPLRKQTPSGLILRSAHTQDMQHSAHRVVGETRNGDPVLRTEQADSQRWQSPLTHC